MNKKIHISVSLDCENDLELYGTLQEQSESPGSNFSVEGCSEPFAATDAWSSRARRRIRRADQLIVLCGEHTDEARGVLAEIRIAQEEGTPYFLIWGRRGRMCTKPSAARPDEGMYSWTSEIIEGQLAAVGRNARRDASARALKRRVVQHRPSPPAEP